MYTPFIKAGFSCEQLFDTGKNNDRIIENMFGGSTMQPGDKKTIERVYNYICNYINNNQISPSVRDICAGVGLKSTSSVHTYLKQLDSQGRIEYRPGLRRAIVIKQGTADYELESPRSSSVSDLGSYREVPVIGKITAA